MGFNQTLQAGGRGQFIAEGNFLFVENCPGKVRIYAQRGQYELTKGSQIKSDTITGQITVENLGEAGQITLAVGFGEYVPPQKDSIEVSAMPAVEIADGQAVEVSVLPAVEIAPGQSVDVFPQLSGVFSSSAVTMPHSFAANSARKKLIIQASEANLNAVKVGAFSLVPGQCLELETTAAINVTGQASDTIEFIEV